MGYLGYILELYWGMEKKMETTIMGYLGYISGLYWANGKENGNYCLAFRGLGLGGRGIQAFTV